MAIKLSEYDCKKIEKCELFNFNNNMNNKNKLNDEDTLKAYLIDLNKVYNSTINENQLIDFLNENENTKDTNENLETKFNLCKEKALSYLIESENINNNLDKVFKNGSNIITNQDIKILVENRKSKKQTKLNDLINFYKLFELDLDSAEENKVKPEDFIGLDLLKNYLLDILNKLVGSSLLHLDDTSIKNLFIYGLPGSGKMSFLKAFFNLKNLLRMTRTQEYQPDIKLIFIDFKSILTNFEYLDLFFVENLFKSINLLMNKNKLNIILIIEHIEYLETSKIYKKRFIGDLLFELGQYEKSIDFEMINQKRIIFIVLSEMPWALTASFLYQFKIKIYIKCLGQIELEMLLKLLMKRISKSFNKDWLFKDKIYLFIKNQKIFNLIFDNCKNLNLTCGLVYELFSIIEILIKFEIKKEFDENLERNGLKIEDFELFKTSTQKSTSKKSKNWRNLNRKLIIINKFAGNKISVFSRNSFIDRKLNKKSSSALNINSLNHSNDKDFFEKLKSQVWQENETRLKDMLLEKCKNYLSTRSISNDLIKKYENFMKNYEFL